MYDTASELYNDLVETFFNKDYDVLQEKRSKTDAKHHPTNLKLDKYAYGKWYIEKLVDGK